MKRILVSFLLVFAALPIVAGQGVTDTNQIDPTSIPLEDIRPATGDVYGLGDPSAPKGKRRPDGLQRPVCDFDGDGLTDLATVRLSGANMIWRVRRSSTLTVTMANFGLPTDHPVPGDYDGDGKWDIAVYREGIQSYFYILLTLSNTIRTLQWGKTNDYPRSSQDFDGDGLADPTVTRNNFGFLTWYINRSALGPTTVYFGIAPADLPVRGDFDGDGKADLAVYRKNYPVPSPDTFFVLRSSDGILQAQNWGTSSTDTILPADFDGDGKTDYTVWRDFGLGTWYWLRSSDTQFDSLSQGEHLDLPAPGDYDGDGKTDQAVLRPDLFQNFYINRSLLGPVTVQFSSFNESPVAWELQAR